MDELDRRIVNALQIGLPLCPRPFADAGSALGMSEADLLRRLASLLERGILTRFGPMYDAERLGGAFSLCAMSIPEADFDRVVRLVNAHPEVAHNYERAHRLNLWFVLAVDDPSKMRPLLRAIEAETGYAVLDLPREAEYGIGLRFAA